MSKQIIGFDFDLTLADSKVGIRACLEKICSEASIDFDKKQVSELAQSGLTLENMLQQLLKTEFIDREKKRFMELYPSLGVKGTTLIPGAREVLFYLRNEGCRIVLISAKQQVNLELSLRHLNLEFDEVHGGLSGVDKSSKMSKLKIDAYIGDQLSDIEAANAANVRAILVGEDLNPQTARKYNYIHFKNLDELKNALPLILE